MIAETVVQIVRSSSVECIHRGHIAVVNTQGEVLYSVGDSQYVTYARSCAKPLQAIPLVELGVADFYQLSDQEIALICSSHNGETEHTNTVRSLLTKIGLEASFLQCGNQEPYDKVTAYRLISEHQPFSALHNTCSGKHAGMLTLSKYLNVTPDHYFSPDHPVQQLMYKTVSEMSGLPMSQIHLGVDGCGVPVFEMPIHHLAIAYARLGTPTGLSTARAEACTRILDCIRKHPYYLAGKDRFDTALATVTQGQVVGKMGAEGVYAMTVPHQDLGIVIKIEDGAQRALYPTAVEVLNQLHLLSVDQLEQLKTFHTPAIHNRRNEAVGLTKPYFHLTRH